jgi:hypothetical protein
MFSFFGAPDEAIAKANTGRLAPTMKGKLALVRHSGTAATSDAEMTSRLRKTLRSTSQHMNLLRFFAGGKN